MRKILLIIVLILAAATTLRAQKQFPPKLEWSRCYGGSNTDNLSYSIVLKDSCILSAGVALSIDGDLVGNYNGCSNPNYCHNGWVLKTDRFGNIVSNKTYYTGSGFLSIDTTNDKGYVISTTDYSISLNPRGTIMKYDSLGQLEWGNSLSILTQTYVVKQTTNGNYFLIGVYLGNVGVAMFDKYGTLKWLHSYGGNREEYAQGFCEVNPNSFTIFGRTKSDSLGVTGNHSTSFATFDAWIFNIDSNGTQNWQKCLGGSGDEFGLQIIPNQDNTYWALMTTKSFDGDVVDNHGISASNVAFNHTDFWVAKLDSVGNILKKKCFGSTDDDNPWSFIKKKNGDLVLTGLTGKPDGDLTGMFSTTNVGRVWIFRVDSNLNIKWNQSFEGGNAGYIKEIVDNEYCIVGRASSNTGIVTNWHPGYTPDGVGWDDAWIFKLDKDTIYPYPTMQGNIYTDNNSNGVKDILEPYKSNVKVQLSNGNYTFTDNNGFYQIQADSIGAYTLTVTAPNLYNAVPQTIHYNFTSWDTVVTKNIALQPSVVKDSVAINVIPLIMNAVQGGAMLYDVQYDNAGTTLLSPNVALTYNNYILTYDSCTDATVQPIPNGILAGEPNMQPGKHNGFISFFTIKPSANIGDTLTTVYSITTPTVSQTDSFYMIVEGGIAKADAQRATPSLTDAQVAAGKDIIYTIGFKNTGNDTAYNIVITDTLSSLLKANTLQMIASSHSCKTTVKGNVVTFELLNIKLPKASSNTLKSIGYVSFKIKPQSNLTAGTVITNKANTYYNYRSPQSSIATTVIKAVGTVPLKFTNYELRFTNGSGQFPSGGGVRGRAVVF